MNTPSTIEKAQAKAKELVDKFLPHVSWGNWEEQSHAISNAKDCAIILVDEIIASTAGKPENWNINVYWMNERFYNHKEFHEYLASVKEQILLL